MTGKIVWGYHARGCAGSRIIITLFMNCTVHI